MRSNTAGPVDPATHYAHHRDTVVSWLRLQLIGPGHERDTESEQDILAGTTPSRRYPTGILFPVVKDSAGLDAAVVEDDADGEEDAAGGGAQGEAAETAGPVRKRRYVPPSAAGFSFYAQGPLELDLTPWAVRYEKTSLVKQQWKRVPLGRYEELVLNFQAPDAPGEERRPIWGDRAELFLLWRRHGPGWLVTVSLCNRQRHDPDRVRDAEKDFEQSSLFEVELGCRILQGRVCPYPGRDPALLSDEERELELQYDHHKVYAVGHGAAVDWRLDPDGDERLVELVLDFLPRAEVPTVTPDNPDLDATTLSLAFLADGGREPARLCAALDTFVDAYGAWQQAQRDKAGDLDARHHATAERVLGRIDQALGRMRLGIDLLRKEPLVLRAFTLANQAMLRQMAQSSRLRGGGRERGQYRWRPFQLGFFLLALESIVHPDSPHRDVVDLIWFPTGGGKTEAYLALIALQIAWRRLHYPDRAGGTAVLMRYTLRLLTQQQFQRAAMLICALEILRRQRPGELGADPITAGLWVGGVTTPNRFRDAMEVLAKATEAPRKLVITECPWCGTPLWDGQGGGYGFGPKHFHFLCSNPDCELGEGGATPLPLNVVDEALYQDPPTLLFATIDKFARLAWEARATVFFGSGANRPPELVIQDELHLVASALGSVAGGYEAALDTVLALRGVRPKTIASTATIRDAGRQVRRLYGKDYAVFPPQGLSADDSFYTRTLPVEERPGRLYLGYLASAMRKRDAFAALAAALLAAPLARFREQPELLDAWWTLLVYHGSLRGVGESHNTLQYFTLERLRGDLERSRGADTQSGEADPDSEPPAQRTRHLETRQLTSIMSAQENSRTFARLQRGVGEAGCLDALLATNMVSVGLDVGRLALMVVNGQPFTSAEYIQASSRVGRAEVPGIIVANYYRHQARSLSHYEHFRAYHQSFYRYVEPTSVTPYTYQARIRTLHAALVIVMRHAVEGLGRNEDAGRFDPEQPAVRAAIARLLERCRAADAGHGDAVAKHLASLVAAWAERARNCRAGMRKLVYRQPRQDRANEALLYSHDDTAAGLWETLNSMRNVEDSARIYPTGPFPPPGAPRS